MSMLAGLVEVVIGVDTHSQTHTAAVLDARTGAVLARATVTADPDGYAELVVLAEAHSGLRAWAMEGTGGYGAGLARHHRRAGRGAGPTQAARPAGQGQVRSDRRRARRPRRAGPHPVGPAQGRRRTSRAADAADRPPRRRAEGKTDREAKRCLKRYIARELYRRLEAPPSALDAP
ncbi:transposase [Blastococcus sp. HT6-30]|uniref:IS110 family transposase n=1 Tax=Blastococcus sp. HT6-30 TaxID=3144843 RepID=UPI00321B74C4